MALMGNPSVSRHGKSCADKRRRTKQGATTAGLGSEATVRGSPAPTRGARREETNAELAALARARLHSHHHAMSMSRPIPLSNSLCTIPATHDLFELCLSDRAPERLDMVTLPGRVQSVGVQDVQYAGTCVNQPNHD